MAHTTALDIDAPGSSLVIQMLLVETYGPRLNVEQLAKVLGLSKGAIYNQISARKFPVETYLDCGKRWADYRDVAAHLDRCRHLARGSDARPSVLQSAHAGPRNRAH